MTSSARRYAEVIGDPIDSSLSPIIHNFWLDVLGIDAEYRRQQVARTGFPAFLEQRRRDAAWCGCNVTMPLKLDALALADESTDPAVAAGAANILLPLSGVISAGNTDIGAVLELLRRRFEAGAPAARIVLLGSGGAARAALMALHLLGLHAVEIHSRDTTAAYKLAVQFALELEPQDFGAPVAADGLINATPLGMAGSPPLALDLGGIAAQGWVMDFVTAPAETALLAAARQRGLATVDGIAILVEQAAESFELFFGAQPPRERDAELLARLRA